MQVGIHEAKTQFSELVKKLQSGESIEVTNRGVVVAELTLPKTERIKRAQGLIDHIKNVRSKVGDISTEELQSWRVEGRL